MSKHKVRISKKNDATRFAFWLSQKYRDNDIISTLQSELNLVAILGLIDDEILWRS